MGLVAGNLKYGAPASGGIIFAQPEGATPIDPDEAEGLIPSLSTQAELSEFEFLNIVEGSAWAVKSRKVKSGILNISVLMQLHERMFGETWRWAGKFRKTQKSIGCEAGKIDTELMGLLEDMRVWIEHSTYSPNEIVARFHHRLVAIHPIPNGNGRFSRLATDLLCRELGSPASHWGSADLVGSGELRSEYIEALRAADAHDYRRLLEFMG